MESLQTIMDITDDMQIGFLVLKGQKPVVSNKTLRKICSLDQELPDVDWLDLLLSQSKARLTAFNSIVEDSGTTRYLKTEITLPDGRKKWTNLSLRPITVNGSTHLCVAMTEADYNDASITTKLDLWVDKLLNGLAVIRANAEVGMIARHQASYQEKLEIIIKEVEELMSFLDEQRAELD